MLPRWHFLLGAIFILIIWLFIPQMPIIYMVLIFLATFLVDFDHYAIAVFKTKKHGLRNAFEYHRKKRVHEIKEKEQGIKKKGDFPTPETIITYMIKWAIRFPNEKILDPACGDGRFLYRAYEHLLNMNVPEQKAIKLLYGVEIDSCLCELIFSRWKNN